MLILDTNIVSEPLRPAPSSAVLNWLNNQNMQDVFITSITVAELFFGVEIMPDGKRRDTLCAAIETGIVLPFRYKTLAFDDAAARIYAKILANQQRHGRHTKQSDLEIASIALAHGAIFVTRNVKDFEQTGVAIINPFES